MASELKKLHLELAWLCRQKVVCQTKTMKNFFSPNLNVVLGKALYPREENRSLEAHPFL
jgi:hypothetical protein